MKNLVNKIGTITKNDQIKMLKKAGRNAELEMGRSSFSRIHKDKKKESNRKECRSFAY